MFSRLFITTLFAFSLSNLAYAAAGDVVKTIGPVNQLGEMSPPVVALPKITAPSTTIYNRAKVTDFANDLLPKFGIDRIMVQQIVQVQGELGGASCNTSTGAGCDQPVWKPINDTHDQVRFVGSGWFNNVNAYGQYIESGADHYIEITFYGTGINYLTRSRAAGRDHRYSVDGATESVSTFMPNIATTLDSRNYSQNHVVPVVSNLSPGLHTIKLRNADGISMVPYGFEILNTSSATSLILAPGTSYANGQKLTKAASSTIAYNCASSTCESGTLGTKGGHVLVYQKKDGSVAKAVTPTDVTGSTNLSNVTHANEEIVRQYNWREFGAGRTQNDDFSLTTSTPRTAAFTLDDGTTTLVGSSVLVETTGGGVDAMRPVADNDYITLTFVGSGLDLIKSDSSVGGSDTSTVSIDGGSPMTFSTTGVSTSPQVVKIVSGLSYGTHTAKFKRISGASFHVKYIGFIVYAPKTPSLPTGAVALADYFLMGDYGTGTVAGLDTVAPGVLRKMNTREHVYVGGGWTAASISMDGASGFSMATSTNGEYKEVTFFGTGFEYRGRSHSGFSGTNTVYLQNLTTGLNGAGVSNPTMGATASILRSTDNWPGLTTGAYGYTFTYSTGNLSLTPTTDQHAGFRVSGLPLALYKLRVTNGTSLAMWNSCLDIITPIHSPKNNGPFVLQNTLSVGSQGIRDLRNFGAQVVSPMKSVVFTKGISSPTQGTPYNVDYPIADTLLTIKTTGGPLEVGYSASISQNTSQATVYTSPYVDGVRVCDYAQANGFTIVPGSGGSISGTFGYVMNDKCLIPVSAGYHTIWLSWQSEAGTMTGQNTRRHMFVKELGN